jgi:SAM-dependent methyltransferase
LKPSQTYPAAAKGDRICPRRSHWRYNHLTILYKRLQEIVASDEWPGGAALLDFGCAEKPYEALFLEKFERYIGADLPGNPMAELEVAPDGTLGVDDESYDGVLSTQVLEHVGSPEVYLKEAFRVLKPGGHMVLSTHGFWPYHPVPTDYWRWTLDGLERILQEAGFEIITARSVLSFPSTALQLWQDATYRKIPGRMRKTYFWIIQTIIKWIESHQSDRVSQNTDVFVILARRGVRDEGLGARR